MIKMVGNLEVLVCEALSCENDLLWLFFSFCVMWRFRSSFQSICLLQNRPKRFRMLAHVWLNLCGTYAVPVPLPCGAGTDDVDDDDFAGPSCKQGNGRDHGQTLPRTRSAERCTRAVTGARRLGGLGISTATITLLARWSFFLSSSIS